MERFGEALGGERVAQRSYHVQVPWCDMPFGSKRLWVDASLQQMRAVGKKRISQEEIEVGKSSGIKPRVYRLMASDVCEEGVESGEMILCRTEAFTVCRAQGVQQGLGMEQRPCMVTPERLKNTLLIHLDYHTGGVERTILDCPGCRWRGSFETVAEPSLHVFGYRLRMHTGWGHAALMPEKG